MRGIEVGGLGALIYLWLIANSRPTWATYLRICLKNNFKKLVITILTVVRWNLIIALVHFTHFHVFFGHLYIFFWWFVQCKFYCLIFFVSLLKIIFICSVYWFSVRCISCIDFLYFDSSLFTAMTLCYFIRSYLPFFSLCSVLWSPIQEIIPLHMSRFWPSTFSSGSFRSYIKIFYPSVLISVWREGVRFQSTTCELTLCWKFC